MPRRIFIDTDTASDDAVALMMAFKHAPNDLVGISIVAGNVPASQGVQNALYTRDLFGHSVPIYEGVQKPLIRPLKTAQHIHGEDGMGDIGLDVSGRNPNRGHGVEALVDAARRYPGQLELVTLGPLTNVALALSIAPDIATKIKQCTIMGATSDVYGNVTPLSEFNIWCDPEAAQIVFTSEMPKVMVGWDISRKYATISSAEADEILAIGSEAARVAIESQETLRNFCKETSGVTGFDYPDPIAMAIALREDMILASKQAAVSILCQDGPGRGAAVIDDRAFSGQPKSTRLVLKADRDLFMTMVKEALQ